MNTINKRRLKGFTLIELSIVLIIIGLVVGGVLVGQDLISAGKRRKLISEIEKYQTAVFTFEGKYNCFPGDCVDAVTQLGSTDNSGHVIVNGDGNGLVGVFPNDGIEVWQAPLQLQVSNMLGGGPYTGVPGPSNSRHSMVGVNVLGSNAYPLVGFTLVNWGGYSDGNDWNPSVWRRFTGNVFLIGYSDSNYSGTFETYKQFLSPLEASMIDTKIDDGNPATGRLVNFSPNIFPGCTTTNDPTTAQYDLSSKLQACSFMLLLN